MINASCASSATAGDASAASYGCTNMDPLAVYSAIYQEHADALGTSAADPADMQRRVLDLCAFVHNQQHEPKDAVMLDLAMCDLLHANLHGQSEHNGTTADGDANFLIDVFSWLTLRLEYHHHRSVMELGENEEITGTTAITQASAGEPNAPIERPAVIEAEMIRFALEMQQLAIKRLLSVLLDVLDMLPLSPDEPNALAVMEAMGSHLRSLLVSLITNMKLTPQDHTHELQLLAGESCSPIDPWSLVLKCPEHVLNAIDMKDASCGLVYRFAKMEWLQFHHAQNASTGVRRNRRKSFWSANTEPYLSAMTVRRIASMCVDALGAVLAAACGEHNEMLRSMLLAASQIEQPLLLEAAILAFGIIFGATEHDQVDSLGDLLPNFACWLMERLNHSSYLVRRIAAWALCNCATILSEIQVHPQCNFIPACIDDEAITEPITAAELAMIVLSTMSLDQDYHVRTVALDALDGLMRMCGLRSEIVANFAGTQLHLSLLEASVMSPRVSMIPNQHIINMCRAVGTLSAEADRNYIQLSFFGTDFDNHESPDDQDDTLISGLATLVTSVLHKAAHSDFDMTSCACECLAMLCAHKHDISRECVLQIALAARRLLESSAPLFLAENATTDERSSINTSGRESFSRMPTFVSRDSLSFSSAVLLLVARLLQIPECRADVWASLMAPTWTSRSSDADEEDGDHGEDTVAVLAHLARHCIDTDPDFPVLKLIHEICAADSTVAFSDHLRAILTNITPCATSV